jgi:hypothetical protein
MVTNNTLTIRSRRPPKRPLDLQFAAASEIVRRCADDIAERPAAHKGRSVATAVFEARDRVEAIPLSSAKLRQAV